MRVVGALEQHVLDEVRDAARARRLVPRSPRQPDADRDRPHVRHRLGEETETVVEDFSDNHDGCGRSVSVCGSCRIRDAPARWHAACPQLIAEQTWNHSRHHRDGITQTLASARNCRDIATRLDCIRIADASADLHLQSAAVRARSALTTREPPSPPRHSTDVAELELAELEARARGARPRRRSTHGRSFGGSTGAASPTSRG